MPAHTWAVELLPTRQDVDYTRLTLVVDRTSLSVVQLRATDFQNAVSAFTFSELEENRDLPDALFTFQIPRGSEVVTGNGFGR